MRIENILLIIISKIKNISSSEIYKYLNIFIKIDIKRLLKKN